MRWETNLVFIELFKTVKNVLIPYYVNLIHFFAGKKTMIYYDMNDYRQKLIDERKRIEELLKAGKPPVS